MILPSKIMILPSKMMILPSKMIIFVTEEGGHASLVGLCDFLLIFSVSHWFSLVSHWF